MSQGLVRKYLCLSLGAFCLWVILPLLTYQHACSHRAADDSQSTPFSSDNPVTLGVTQGSQTDCQQCRALVVPGGDAFSFPPTDPSLTSFHQLIDISPALISFKQAQPNTRQSRAPPLV
ncbi:MAG: hypothetical protein LBU79_03360 [Planctomycetota bacterium]|jgi:hypothetical protein|nr:hypothetical protein [Planctomycetota bacterium]